MMAHSEDRLDNRAFQSYVLGQLASTSITSDPRTAELQTLWQEVGKMKYSQEDAFIQELQENNTQKFETLKDIISTEIEYSKQQQQDLKQMSTPSFLTQVAAPDSALERVKGYNTMMEPYNGKTLDAAVQLMQGESETSKKQREDFALEGQKLQQDISQSLSPYTSQNLLAAVTPENASVTPASAGSCDISGSYEYRYEGIYVREYGKNYRLFEYTDMLRGDEEPKILDMDGDSDDDILYLAGGKLYFKENRKVPEAAKSHVSGGPITLQSDDNMFFNGRVYHEAVNYFEEMNVSDAAINVSFLKPTDTTLQNFRMKYHTIVDRYIQEGQEDAIPKENETHVIDALVSRTYGTSENEGIAQISPHLASLVQV